DLVRLQLFYVDPLRHVPFPESNEDADAEVGRQNVERDDREQRLRESCFRPSAVERPRRVAEDVLREIGLEAQARPYPHRVEVRFPETGGAVEARQEV